MNDKPKQSYWYCWHIGECPVCGSDKSYRERVYGQKPTNPLDIYFPIPANECYDGCLG